MSQDVPRLDGRTAVITGATSGLGTVTARALSRAGAHVVVVCRDPDKGRTLAGSLDSSEVVCADLASLDSVRVGADRLARRHARIDLLINNAGVFQAKSEATTDGFEIHFGVNHLAHFLLTGLLLDCLTRGRVVTISSDSHERGKIDFDALGSGKPWSPEPYADSKLANVLFSRELQRRAGRWGMDLVSVSCHPGFLRTPMVEAMPDHYEDPVQRARISEAVRDRALDPQQGVPVVMFTATGPLNGGDYASPTPDGPAVVDPHPQAADEALASRLWEASEELVGMRIEGPRRARSATYGASGDRHPT